jgi:hypothetical protein
MQQNTDYNEIIFAVLLRSSATLGGGSNRED